MKILILGGTADARKIAVKLLKAQHNVIYSVAGLVRLPNLDCKVISGGFRQYGGLDDYLTDEFIDAVVDATHPYAIKMTATAVDVCERLALPYFRYARPPWRAKPEDEWIKVESLASLIEKCAAFDNPLLTTGQLTQQQLDEIARNSAKVTYRTAAPSQASLTDNVNWLKALGPFAFEDELALMLRLKTDVLVSKNAGGDATYAKIVAARELKIPVIMCNRPKPYDITKESDYTSLSLLVDAVETLKQINMNVD